MRITRFVGFAACGFVSVLAGASLADDPVVFKGAYINQATSTFFGWAQAWGSAVYAPTGDCKSDGYDILTMPKYWDDEEISSEKDYLIKSNLCAPTAPASGATFGGNKLTVGVVSATDDHTSGNYASSTTMGWLALGSGSVTFANEGLYAANGGIWMNATSPTINGKVTVLAPVSNPFWLFEYAWSNPTITINADLVGEEGTAIYGRTAGANSGNYNTYRFNGDLSGYHGLIDFKKGAHAYFGGEATYMPGKLRFGANATLQPAGSDNTGALRFGALEFTSSDATVSLGVTSAAVGTLRVDDSIAGPADGSKPKFRYALPCLLGYVAENWRLQVTNLTARHIELADIPAAIPSLDSVFDVANTISDASLDIWSRARLSAYDRYVKVEDGRRVYCVDIPKCTYQSKTYERTILRPFDANAGEFWWNGMSPADSPDAAETAYFIPSGVTSTLPVQDDYVFPGRKLILTWSTMMKQYGDVTVNGMVWHPFVYWYSYVGPLSRQQNAIKGNLVLAPDFGNTKDSEDSDYLLPSSIQVERKLVIDANVSGDGIVELRNVDEDLESGIRRGDARIELNGDNSGFCGKFRIRNTYASDGFFTDVCASNACGFGGMGCRSGSFRALDLRVGGRLNATASFELNEPTRGVYVNGKGAIKVENAADTFALGSQLTMDGELEKYGPGTLALKGALRYTKEQGTTPVAGKNVLTVREGSVRGMAKAATDGLAVGFAAGAAIGVASPLATVSDEERDFGFYQVAGSLDLTGTSGKLNVTIDSADLANWPDSFSRNLITVPNAVAETLKGNVRLVRKPKGYAMTAVAVPNADGATTTFRGDFYRGGTAIILR